MTIRKKHFLQHMEKYKNTEEAYTDGPKRIRKNIGFGAVLADITRRGVLPKEASIYIVEMTAIKKSIKNEAEDM